MKVTAEAQEDIDRQDCDRKKLSQEIKDRLSKDRDKEDISYINKPEFGVEFHRLKLKQKGLDHRVYFDYLGSELVFFAVRHRDYAYTREDLKEVERRLEAIEKE